MYPKTKPLPYEQVLNVLNGFSADGNILGKDGKAGDDAPDAKLISELYAALCGYLEEVLNTDTGPDAARTSLIMILLAALQIIRPDLDVMRRLILLCRAAAGIATH